MDGVSKFVLRVRAFQYYRIELPSDSEADKERVEEIKTAWKKILRYEVTPCPFQRGFRVELPAEAHTPKKKKAWTPRKSIGTVNGLNHSQTTPDSGHVSESRPHSSLGLMSPLDKSVSEGAGLVEDDALSDHSVSASESGTSGRDHTPEPTETSSTTAPKSSPKVKAAIDVFEQEAAKAARRRDSWLNRTPSGAPLPPETELSQTSTPASSLLSEICVNDEESPELAQASLEAPSNTVDSETKLSTSSGKVDQEDNFGHAEPDHAESIPVRAHKDQSTIPQESKSVFERSSVVSNDDLTMNQKDHRHELISLSAEREYSSSSPFVNELVDEASAPSTNSGKIDEHSPTTDSDINSPIFGIPKEDFVNLTVLANTSAAMPEEESDVGDSVRQSEPLAIPGQTPNLEAQSTASSVGSFHSVASMDFGDDIASSHSPEKFGSPRSMSPVPLSKSCTPAGHKRDLSNLTVTAESSMPSARDEDDEPISPGNAHAINLIPPTPSAVPDWPSISPSSPADSFGLRQRALRPRRSLSPLPHPSTILQTRSSTTMSSAIVQKATEIAIGKPIEMVLILMHVLGRIAGGATVADLLSGDLFRRPNQSSATNNGAESGDEDDFGIPIRGRDRSRDSITSRRRRPGTRTPSELD